MKRSNLFLTLTTGCLAVASFAFAKSHQKHVSVGYCTNADHSACNIITQKVMTINANAGLNKATCAANNKTAHTTVGGLCAHTLYTKGE